MRSNLLGGAHQKVWLHDGQRSVAQLNSTFDQYQKVLLVYDEGAFALCGAKAFLEPMLTGCEVASWPITFTLPSLERLQYAMQTLALKKLDAIVAVGGGTTIDLAKLVRYFGGGLIPQAQSIKKQDGLPLNIPLVTVPTTSGSGSEATPFAVLYVDGIKHSIAHDSILPDFVYLHPQLTSTLPKKQRAATGLDALCQAIESYWSVNATSSSQELSREAIREAKAHLAEHVNNPDDPSREGMVIASHLAGRAIAQAKTTVCHALSYTMTSRYSIPHGIAVALTLGRVLVYNSGVTDDNVLDPRGAEYVRKTMREIVGLLGYTGPEEASLGISTLLDTIVGGHTLQYFGVHSEEDMLYISNTVNLERLKNNPRRVTQEALRAFLR